MTQTKPCWKSFPWQRAGDYDIVIADDYILENVIQEGLAEKLDKSSCPALKISTLFIRASFMTRRMHIRFLMVQESPLIVYDPEMVDIDIKGYADLWDPSLEDSIALVANYRVINGITNLMLGKSMNEEDVDSIKETGRKASGAGSQTCV